MSNLTPAGGIPAGLQTMERVTFVTAWREKAPRGIMLVISGFASAAAARSSKPHEDVRWTT
jgi:hypothetical protein